MTSRSAAQNFDKVHICNNIQKDSVLYFFFGDKLLSKGVKWQRVPMRVIDKVYKVALNDFKKNRIKYYAVKDDFGNILPIFLIRSQLQVQIIHCHLPVNWDFLDIPWQLIYNKIINEFFKISENLDLEKKIDELSKQEICNIKYLSITHPFQSMDSLASLLMKKANLKSLTLTISQPTVQEYNETFKKRKNKRIEKIQFPEYSWHFITKKNYERVIKKRLILLEKLSTENRGFLQQGKNTTKHSYGFFVGNYNKLIRKRLKKVELSDDFSYFVVLISCNNNEETVFLTFEKGNYISKKDSIKNLIDELLQKNKICKDSLKTKIHFYGQWKK